MCFMLLVFFLPLSCFGIWFQLYATDLFYRLKTQMTSVMVGHYSLLRKFCFENVVTLWCRLLQVNLKVVYTRPNLLPLAALDLIRLSVVNQLLVFLLKFQIQIVIQLAEFTLCDSDIKFFSYLHILNLSYRVENI